eukprot:11557043-Prorocentrum_lima.AAC.1
MEELHALKASMAGSHHLTERQLEEAVELKLSSCKFKEADMGSWPVRWHLSFFFSRRQGGCPEIQVD